MKTKTVLSFILLLSILSASCNLLTNAGVKVIAPSNNIISENRAVSGFKGIEFSTFGKVNIIQSDKESLNINGPDNLVSEISTSVNNGILVIKNKENFTVSSLNQKDILTFTIGFKELTSLNVSGAGDVQVETLSTTSMDVNMSGAGNVVMNQLTTGNFSINISGLGGLEVTGSATQATIDISGAGNVNAPDFKVHTANVTISGLGGATVWVTDSLTGDISGAGSVSYYGNPQTSTKATGLGTFKSLGSK